MTSTSRRYGGAGIRRGIRQVANGGAASIDPSTVSGLVIDVFAGTSVHTTAGTGVDSITDDASGLVFEQSTDAKRPSYSATGLGGQPSYSFNGVGDVLVESTAEDSIQAGGGDVTVYFFGSLTAAPTTIDETIIDFELGRLWLLMGSLSAGNMGYFDGAWRSIAAPGTGAHVWTWVLEHGVGGEIFRDGTSLGTAAFSNPGLGGIVGIGGHNNQSSQFFGGEWGRLLVYTDAHDTATRQGIEAWGSYYGL